MHAGWLNVGTRTLDDQTVLNNKASNGKYHQGAELEVLRWKYGGPSFFEEGRSKFKGGGGDNKNTAVVTTRNNADDKGMSMCQVAKRWEDGLEVATAEKPIGGGGEVAGNIFFKWLSWNPLADAVVPVLRRTFVVPIGRRLGFVWFVFTPFSKFMTEIAPNYNASSCLNRFISLTNSDVVIFQLFDSSFLTSDSDSKHIGTCLWLTNLYAKWSKHSV